MAAAVEVTVVGCGGVGRKLAADLALSGARVAVWDQSVGDRKRTAILGELPEEDSRVAARLSFHDVLAESFRAAQLTFVATLEDRGVKAHVSALALRHCRRRDAAVLVLTPRAEPCDVDAVSELIAHCGFDVGASDARRRVLGVSLRAPVAVGAAAFVLVPGRLTHPQTVSRAAELLRRLGKTVEVVSAPADESMADFLARLGLEKYRKRFEKEEVTLLSLPLLTETDLKKTLGLPLGPRRLILSEAAKIAASQQQTAAVQEPALQFLAGVVPGTIVGSGSFGTVFRGLWNGFTPVAMKELGEKTAKEAALREARLMSSLRHPNVCSIYGVAQHAGGMFLVMELAEGSVLQLLRSQPPKKTKMLLRMALSCAAGMAYLAEMRIVHRDLAARNLLYVRDGPSIIAKVSDFGLATTLGSQDAPSAIPVRWTAPEAIKRGEFSTKSDVWSFGVVLWELFSSGSEPYAGVDSRELSDLVIQHRLRLEKPESCPEDCYTLMQACWSADPTQRPSFVDVCATLSKQIPVGDTGSAAASEPLSESYTDSSPGFDSDSYYAVPSINAASS